MRDHAVISDEELDEIEFRAVAAAKGPWYWESPRGYPQRVSNARADIICETFTNPDFPAYDAEFISHAKEDVERLVAEVRRLKKERIKP